VAKEAKRRGIDTGIPLGDRIVHPDAYAELQAAIQSELQAWHAAHPLAPGAPRRALTAGALQALPERSWVDLFQRLHDDNVVVLDGPRVRLADFSVVLDPAQQAARDALTAALTAAELKGLKYAEVVANHPELLHLLIGDGVALRVSDQVLLSATLSQLKTDVLSFLSEHGQMLPSDFKELTGLSRRHAIPLLEWLDATKVTTRSGNARIPAAN